MERYILLESFYPVDRCAFWIEKDKDKIPIIGVKKGIPGTEKDLVYLMN